MASVRASDDYPLELLSVKRQDFREVSGSARMQVAQAVHGFADLIPVPRDRR